MKELELPTERRQASNYNPRLAIIYGRPKSGKSSAIASLDDNLVIDLDDGYRALSVMSVRATSVSDMFELRKKLKQKMAETGVLPYRFITIDNATRLEEFCIPYAAALYRKTAMSGEWGYLKDKGGNLRLDANDQPIPDPKADVRTLPKGQGYLYLREALKEIIHMFHPYCETLILVCHVKDREIREDGVDSTELTVDLAGKLADIICGEADAVGYLYRSGKQTLLSFVGGDDTLKEARPLHLRGQRFVVGESDENNVLTMDLNKIFLESDVKTMRSVTSKK